MKSLVSHLGHHRKSVAIVYSLLVADHLVSITIPAFTGAALDGLLAGAYGGLIGFTAVWVIGATLSAIRQSYDTRAFSRISAEFASSVASRHSAEGSSLSVVAARSSLSRELISFFAQHLPTMGRGAIVSLGALAMLLYYDAIVGALCALLLIPTAAVNIPFLRRSLKVNRKLNNRIERELLALETKSERAVVRHYRALSRRRISLSDAEALTAYVMSLAALAMLVLAMLTIAEPGRSPGEMYAVIAYALAFFSGLSDIPPFVGGIARMRDIQSRLR